MCLIDIAIASYIGIISITSGHRTIDHNKKVGGAKHSHHLTKCGARDVVVDNKFKAVSYFLENGYRVLQYKKHLHIDTSKKEPRYIVMEKNNG